MKIQYASDLHLEFDENSRFLQKHPLTVTGDILVLAGDIGYLGDKYCERHPFWDWAAGHYEQVIAIPGNHEFYRGFDMATMKDGWSYALRSNVRYYNNQVISLGAESDLIVTPLWAQIPFDKAAETVMRVNDFRNIRCENDILRWTRFNEEHFRCFRFLNEAVKRSKAKHIVVMTHHAPSSLLMAPEFQDSPINGAFMVDLTDYIEARPIEYWIYGHSHRNIDATIRNTRCLSNQLGYVDGNEHISFDPTRYIEIPMK